MGSNAQPKEDLNKLNLFQLITAVEENVDLIGPANDVFRQKYSQKTFRIEGPFQNKPEDSVFEYTDKVEIQNLEVTVKLLKFFKQSIIRVTVDYILIDGDAERITRAINEHGSSSQSLVVLKLVQCRPDTLKFM